MSSKLYEALELCLQDIERGADVTTSLARFPDLAEELHPLLEAALAARALAAPHPAPDAIRRGRARLLTRAAEMRQQNARRRRFVLRGAFRSAAVALMVVAFLLLSGTGLVRASSRALPGDSLYPVKRTWEGVRLSLVFNPLQREEIEFEIENERLEEIGELFAEGRTENVSFEGWLEGQQVDRWLVSGVVVVITDETHLPDGPMSAGTAVRVHGVTRPEGVVEATEIVILPPDAVVLPEIEEEDDHTEHQELLAPPVPTAPPEEDDDAPEYLQTATPESEGDSLESDPGNNGSENQDEAEGSYQNGETDNNGDDEHSDSPTDNHDSSEDSQD